MTGLLLYTSRRQWFYRWEQTRKGGHALHRIERGTKEETSFVGTSHGRTVCGLKGEFVVPGIFSRMGAPRCAKCCTRLGVPSGDGAPYNAHIPEPVRLP